MLNVRLPRRQAEMVDELVKETGATRSAIFRAALDRYLLEVKEVTKAS